MERKTKINPKFNRTIVIYLFILASIGIAGEFGFSIFSNYLSDVYEINSTQRGFIEIPRELPGLMCFFVVAALSFLGDIRVSIISQILAGLGIIVLGFITPSYSIMIILLFLASMGNHIFMPLQDSIALAISGNDNVGAKLGNFKGFSTGFMMIGSGLAYLGFKSGFFSFFTDVKLSFVISGLLLFCAAILLTYLRHVVQEPRRRDAKIKLIFKREYSLYYILTTLYGIQKQIMIVYGPWVLIELLDQGADTIALITFVGAGIGIFFIPLFGRLVDKFGVKKLLFVDAFSFIIVYVLYGLLCIGFTSGSLTTYGLPLFAACSIVVFDKMSTQMGMIRTLYLRKIAVDTADITPTLTMGVSLDHCLSISGAVLCGYIWTKFGPQYVFFFAAAVSTINVLVATKVKKGL